MIILDKKNLPVIIDLFSGCGGLSLGFQTAGFQISYGIELMQSAVETVSYNLHWRYGNESKHICADITETDPDSLKESIGDKECIVIGGPPCQAYSLVGRAKLRSLGKDRENTNDKRGYLYQDFLNYVYTLDATAVVMENVPESTNYGGMNIPQIVCDSLRRHGYTAAWTILNAADYGVPQTRERVILIGIKNELSKKVSFPAPTNYSDEITQNQLRCNSYASECRSFVMPPKGDDSLPPWITVREALSDLPVLYPDITKKYRLEKITDSMEYRTPPENDYQKLMRGWYGTDLGLVTGNCFRKTLRDFPIFAQMQEGDDYLKASEIAEKLLYNACISRGITPNDKEEYEKLKKSIVPPYSKDKFTSKWLKLTLDKPSHTLVAHLSVDTYSHIHPIEPRGISVREAARLQSFPDGFLLQCSMGDAFKQIGNAVPPLLSKAVAEELIRVLTGE